MVRLISWSSAGWSSLGPRLMFTTALVDLVGPGRVLVLVDVFEVSITQIDCYFLVLATTNFYRP